MIKRTIDVAGSLFGMILILPVLSALFVLVYAKLGAPVLFKQKRPGLNGNIFTFYKFRTMSNKRDSEGELLPDKDRKTPLGNFLRKTSLDELPSLFNVLKGDMSLVGPRPLLVEYLDLYSPEQAHRHDVKPGITGWAQVNGRNSISWEEKFKYDLWYINNHTIWIDIKILLLTIYRVIKKEGINQANGLTMEKFNGTN